jgi:hypothetical protein
VDNHGDQYNREREDAKLRDTVLKGSVDKEDRFVVKKRYEKYICPLL